MPGTSRSFVTLEELVVRSGDGRPGSKSDVIISEPELGLMPTFAAKCPHGGLDAQLLLKLDGGHDSGYSVARNKRAGVCGE